MNAHHRDKARIVDLPPTHAVVVDETTPCGMDLLVIGKKSELALDEEDFLLRFGDRNRIG
jgi:hypothetical protein